MPPAAAAAVSARREDLPDPNRAHRNKLSPMPLPVTHPAPAESNQSESTSNVPRIRKKCVKTILDPSTTPNTQKRVKTVFGKISKQSPGILTTIDDDLEFENSQDAVAQLSLLYGDD